MFKEVAHNSDPVSPQSHLTYFHTYNVFLTLAQYVLPLTAISFAYARMGTKLWLNKTPGAAHVKRDQMIVVNKKKGSVKWEPKLISICISDTQGMAGRKMNLRYYAVHM